MKVSERTLKILIFLLYIIGIEMLINLNIIKELISAKLIPVINITTIFIAILMIFLVLYKDTLKAKRKKMKYSIYFLPIIAIIFLISNNFLSTIYKSWEINLNDKEDIVVIDADNFLNFKNSLENDEKEFYDKEICVLGFIENYNKNSFNISRKVMTCCAADMHTVGIKCRIDENIAVKNGEWVKVYGYIDKYNNFFIKKVKKIQPPKSQYIQGMR